MFPPQRDTYIKVLPQHHRTTTQKKFDVRKYDNMSQHQKNFKAIQYIVQYWLKSAVKSDIILQSILKNSKVFEQKGNLINSNILYPKMCSIRGGDFGNHFSVYGLYVMPIH